MSHELATINRRIQKKFQLEEKHIKFVQWICLPKALRPHKEFIKGQLGISEPTYYAWLNSPVINKARYEMTKQLFADYVPDILFAMKNEAISGNVKAAELVLTFVEALEKEEEDKGRSPLLLNNAQVNILVNKLEQKFYGTNDKSRIDQPIEGTAEPSL